MCYDRYDRSFWAEREERARHRAADETPATAPKEEPAPEPANEFERMSEELETVGRR